VDAQLPPAVARHLEAAGHAADHVVDVGLEAAPDRVIWDYAIAQGAILLTKDEDFAAMRAIREQGPTVIWIRIGNTTRPTLLNALAGAWPAILEALEKGEHVIEVT
jgi:predicted nuclease of predicted toxin-antitoxin system